ncbi:hypothetical protein HG263_05180 [Pseudoalteromonas sp. JBTF-M23]|uniref:Transposase DDE domain-containing protein n=1 Tax=Pseudoalteromonas caenipelagi TaxID=2726988 RepID=A0A849V8P0_9GAMM|nr:hypothetical protein [Pseudoalteromonas caenipelagi]
METYLTFRAVFNLPLRAWEGVVNSLLNIINMTLQSSGYCYLCKRGKTLAVLYRPSASKGLRTLLSIVPGLKVYGNCEWHTRKHHASKRHT